MRLVAAIVVCAALLGGCFWSAAGGPGYENYRISNGLYVQHDNVNTLCISPRLRMAIGDIERHFRKRVVVTSAFRNPFHNMAVGGATNSYHMRCMAVDFFIPGVSKAELLRQVARNPRIGGLGCYNGRTFIHVDVRDRPRGHNGPVTFNC